MPGDDERQLRLFSSLPVAATGPCRARLWLRCQSCGGLETRTLSCSRPCARCPWGTMRVLGASGRLPRVALRHWVLVPPAAWARGLPSDASAAQAFRRAVATRVIAAIERRAHEQLGHGRGKAGALAVLHTVGADLRPRAHVHVVATDGVFVPAVDGVASFVPLVRPFDQAELREVARVVASEARGVASPARSAEEVRGGEVRVRGAGPRGAAGSGPGVVARAWGAEVFVGARVEGHDRRRSEVLAAYVTRPALGPASVRSVGEALVELRFREPAGDGAVAVRLTRPVFEARLKAMVEGGGPRRLALHGVLAPGSSVRWRGAGTQLALVDSGSSERRRRSEVRTERCRCGGRLEVVAAEPV